jgi:hypothetical protein
MSTRRDENPQSSSTEIELVQFSTTNNFAEECQAHNLASKGCKRIVRIATLNDKTENCVRTSSLRQSLKIESLTLIGETKP